MMIAVKWIVGFVCAICLLVLLAMLPLFLRGMRARAGGKIPKGEILIRFRGEKPTDAISWFTRMYFLGFLGVAAATWIISEPRLPQNWQVPMKDNSFNVIILIAAALASFWGTAMCVTYCGDFDGNLRRYGA